MNRLTHWITIPIAFAQGYGQLVLLEQSSVIADVGFTGDALLPTVAALFSIAAGTMFLVWLGEMITERGIGNGISLIIFAGIVAGFPRLLTQGFLDRDNVLGIGFFAIIGVVIIASIVLFNESPQAHTGPVRPQHIQRRQNVPAKRGDLSTIAYKFGGYDTPDICLFHRNSAWNYCDLLRHKYQLGRRCRQFLRRPADTNIAAILGDGVLCWW